MPEDVLGGDVGVAISSCIFLTGALQYGMRQSAEAENLMTSVERIVEYGTLKPEAYLEDACPQSNNKLNGPLKFEHVWLRYAEDEEYVLKDISFTIDEKEKVNYIKNVVLKMAT